MARGAVVAATTTVAIVAGRELAPRGWDIVTYAYSYAVGHVAAGYWDQGQALWFIAKNGLAMLILVILLASGPLLVGWWFSRTRRQQH